ncbi:TPA: ArpU family phage packaging/lysis transcriptional regulator [Listeria innocua]|uniref:ArpU family phage packaging/lysis transcriptional regulator n=1 Tax=Listeria innocua TaxID=1642 RepID=UPI0010CE4964|nr:transcriptional regulator [Listeria innocua]EAH4437636.1 transcriptional regulator [Listeria innocua]EAH4440870.1 transcriptional regulator [Listeria innocua]HBM3533273.1 transcriptional regulator [Listeria innocua]HBM3577284.1 transcriptional regulator [Listeria innocua]
MKNSIDYIKTVQNVKRFFEEFQYLVFLLGPRNKIQLNSEGIVEKKLITDDSSDITAIGKLVQLYTEILNTMKPLHRFILIKCYIDKQKDIATMMELPYEIAQFKRIKKQAVLSLAEDLEIIVEKNYF